MRKTRRIGLVLLSVLIMAAVYYGSYRIYLFKVGNKDKQEYSKQYKENIIEANTASENKITNRTELVIEYYNRKDGTTQEEVENMPAEYIGLQRDELVDYLAKYEEDPTIDDIQEGFEKYQVLSFSDEQVVLRKIFYPPSVTYKYYLVEENGCVTAYYIDKKTVFEYTNIVVDTLPDDIKKQVQKGKYIVDVDSLYDFLENYSS